MADAEYDTYYSLHFTVDHTLYFNDQVNMHDHDPESVMFDVIEKAYASCTDYLENTMPYCLSDLYRDGYTDGDDWSDPFDESSPLLTVHFSALLDEFPGDLSADDIRAVFDLFYQSLPSSFIFSKPIFLANFAVTDNEDWGNILYENCPTFAVAQNMYVLNNMANTILIES